MNEYRKSFTRVTKGYASVNAKSKKEAEKLFEKGDFDEFDYNSDYEWTSEVYQ